MNASQTNRHVNGTPVGNTFDKDASTNPIERRMVAGFTQALMSVLPATSSRILEVGCGEGSQLDKLSSRFDGAQLVGLDLPSPDLAGLWSNIDAAMVFGNGERLPFRDRSFDLVVVLEVLEHVDDPEAVLREVCRVADGNIILSVPREPIWRIGNLARGRYLSEMGNTPGHIQHFSSRKFEQLASRHLRVTSIKRPLPWTMLAGVPLHTSGR